MQGNGFAYMWFLKGCQLRITAAKVHEVDEPVQLFQKTLRGEKKPLKSIGEILKQKSGLMLIHKSKCIFFMTDKVVFLSFEKDTYV